MDLDVFGACQTRRMYESKPPQREPQSVAGAEGAGQRVRYAALRAAPQQKLGVAKLEANMRGATKLVAFFGFVGEAARQAFPGKAVRPQGSLLMLWSFAPSTVPDVR